jgi:hypothetical protein
MQGSLDSLSPLSARRKELHRSDDDRLPQL